MGAAYNILGKQVAPHWLAIGTLATVVGGVQLNSFLGSSKSVPEPAANSAPAAASGELDVEKAINDFLASNDEKKEA